MSWTHKYLEQIVGGFIAMSLFVVFVFLVFSASGGGWFTPQVHFTLVLEEGHGLDPGIPVAISGMEVGHVDSVSLTQDKFVELALSVNRAYAHHVRTDSVGNATMSMGGKVVKIDGGSPDMPALGDGGVLKTGTNFDFFLALERMDLVGNLRRLESILEDINDLAEQMHMGDGRLPETLEGLLVLVEEMQAGKGTVGRLLKEDAVLDDVMRAVASVEGMAASVESASDKLGVTSGEIDGASGAVVTMSGDVSTATEKLGKTADTLDDAAQDLASSLVHLNGALVELERTMKAIQRMPLIKGQVKKVDQEGL